MKRFICVVLVLGLPGLLSGQDLYRGRVSLFSDHKAFKVGDVVTILISESSSASKNISSSSGKQYQTQGGISRFFLPQDSFDLPGWGWSNQDAYSGGGQTSRQESLVATVTGRIVEITPAGLFKISGERSIDINNDKQIIVLEGYARAEDIAHNNTLHSSYLSDVRISVKGKGWIEEKQRPGLLTRLLDIFRIF